MNGLEYPVSLRLSVSACNNAPLSLFSFFHPHILHDFDMFLCLPVSAAAPEGMLERRRRRGVCPRAFVHAPGPGVPARATSGWEPRASCCRRQSPHAGAAQHRRPGQAPCWGQAGGGWGLAKGRAPGTGHTEGTRAPAGPGVSSERERPAFHWPLQPLQSRPRTHPLDFTLGNLVVAQSHGGGGGGGAQRIWLCQPGADICRGLADPPLPLGQAWGQRGRTAAPALPAMAWCGARARVCARVCVCV